MSCLCTCLCCRKPLYKRLVDSLFPRDPQDATPVFTEQDELFIFARATPEHLVLVGDYLALRLRRSLAKNRRGHACVALKITEKLVAECDSQRLQLIADIYLDMLHAMLESTHPDVLILATESFVVFVEREEDSTPYRQKYDFILTRFTVMSVTENTQRENCLRIRLAGLKGLRCVVVRKIERGRGIGMDMWGLDHMNTIVSAFLFNLAQREVVPAAEVGLVSSFEEGLKELTTRAGLTHIDSVFKPVLQHFDLNNQWTKQRPFVARVFQTIVQSMQAPYRYKAIQALVAHLDLKANESCDVKQGILDTLTQCVSVAVDWFLESVERTLGVFKTLVRHLRLSIKKSSTSAQDGAFRDSIQRTMREFSVVLPDNHRTDILILLISDMPPPPTLSGADGGRQQEPEVPLQEDQSAVFALSLVKCLRTVADTYHPAVLETTFSDALLPPLMQLFTIVEPGVQLEVKILWHQLVDHHGNKQNIPLNTTWESLESVGLELGKVSQRFLDKTQRPIYHSLYLHAHILSTTLDNVRAFYQLLCLLVLEFSRPTIMETLQLLSQLQDAAQSPGATAGTRSLSRLQRLALHSVVAGVMYLLAKITSIREIRDHVLEVVARRHDCAPHLLPDSLFAAFPTDCVDEEEDNINPKLLFQFRERGIIPTIPEPRHMHRKQSPPFIDAYTVDPNYKRHPTLPPVCD